MVRCCVTTAWRFEFIKVSERFVWERNGFAGKVNSAYILWIKSTYPIAVLYFLMFVSSSGRSNTVSASYRSMGSTAKRKTRLHTDFRTARRLKQINPLKITLPTQFLRRIEEEMLKVHVRLFARQFHPRRLRYKTFFCKIASPATSNIALSNVSGTFSRYA